jgi:hypothetical protein
VKISRFYKKKNFRELLKYSEIRYNKLTSVEKIYLCLAIFELGFLDEFLDLFEYFFSKNQLVIEKYLFERNSEEYCKLILYKALAHFGLGEYANAHINIRESISMSRLYSSEAKKWEELLCLSGLSDPSYFIENNNLRFYFMDKSNEQEIAFFIKKYQVSYDDITFFFRSTPRKKTDVYIYKGRKDVIGNRLSYSNPHLGTIHANLYDENGHELTHVICQSFSENYSDWDPFVKEGIAEHFNSSCYEIDVTKFPSTMDLFNVWTRFSDYNVQVSYPIAKLFFDTLISVVDRDELFIFLQHPNLQNAKKRFKDKFNEITALFYKNYYQIVENPIERIK